MAGVIKTELTHIQCLHVVCSLRRLLSGSLNDNASAMYRAHLQCSRHRPMNFTRWPGIGCVALGVVSSTQFSRAVTSLFFFF